MFSISLNKNLYNHDIETRYEYYFEFDFFVSTFMDRGQALNFTTGTLVSKNPKSFSQHMLVM